MMIVLNQKGYTATAMIIMLAIGGILTTGAARYAVRTSTENAGNALGQALNQVNRALSTHTINNSKALVDGTMSLTPSIADLQNAGLLNATFNPVPPIGGSYATQISREPAGCVAPNCNLTARVWYTQPVINLNTGNVDIAKIGAAAAAIGGDGGWSDASSSNTVKGLGGWTRPNPAGASPGILMAISGYGSSVFTQYVDRAGRQGMLADFRMGGNNIVDAATVNANQLILPSGDTLRIGNTFYHGDSANGAVRTPGTMYIQHYDTSAAPLNAGGINSEGRLTATGDVIAGQNMTAGGNLVAAQVYSNGETSTAGYFRTNGDGGWYSQKWNGGLYMSDGAWVRSYADKSMYTGGEMQAGTLQANSSLRVLGTAQVDGNQTVGSQTVYGQQIVGGSQTVYGNAAVTNALTPGQIAAAGASCTGIAGAIGRDASNNLFICN